MKEILQCEAIIENLDEVRDFVEEKLAELACNPKLQLQLLIATEEIFVNIAHYAYAKLDENGQPIQGTGSGPMTLVFEEENSQVTLTFEDEGTPFNPLEKTDPDITLSAEDRTIGGLGILMVKKSMDEVSYEYKDGKNIFKIMKRI